MFYNSEIIKFATNTSSSSSTTTPTETTLITTKNMKSRRLQKCCSTYSALGITNMSSKLFLTILLLGIFTCGVKALEKKTAATDSSKLAAPSSTSSTHTTGHREEIYIDDEGLEGSGGRGEIHDDLEKDPDYSGSGLGPDDEDSSTDQDISHKKTITNLNNIDDNKNIISNTNDITSRTNSGSFSSSGGNNNGIISGSSGTGNTIESSASLPTINSTTITTTTITTTNNNNNKNISTTITTNNNNNNNTNNKTQIILTTTNTDNKQNTTHIIPSQSKPSISKQHTTDDDFDLDGENIGGFAGSGDGGYIDRDDEDGDDDNDNDDDEDDDEDNDNDNDEDDNEDEHIDDLEHIDPSQTKHTLDKDIKPTINKVDIDDDENDDEHDEDYGTEMYTEVTDPNNSSKNSGQGGFNVEHPALKPGINNQGTIELDSNNINSVPPDTKIIEHTAHGNEVLIMNTSEDDRTTSFFAQPGILAAVIGGAVVGLLCAILVVMFIVYRMRKKDEGSYALDEPKRSPAVNSYAKNGNNREFYA